MRHPGCKHRVHIYGVQQILITTLMDPKAYACVELHLATVSIHKACHTIGENADHSLICHSFQN